MSEADDVKKILEKRGHGKASRTLRTLELRTLGFPYPDIAEKLRDEGFKTSYSTVRNDLAYCEKLQLPDETRTVPYRNEIVRRQLMDIAQADIEIRLKARAHIIDKLYPQIHYSARVEDIKADSKDIGDQFQELVSKVFKDDAHIIIEQFKLAKTGSLREVSNRDVPG